jgi:hypothetical protein
MSLLLMVFDVIGALRQLVEMMPMRIAFEVGFLDLGSGSQLHRIPRLARYISWPRVMSSALLHHPTLPPCSQVQPSHLKQVINMKFSITFALLSLIGSTYAAPASSNSVVQRDGKDYDKSADKSRYEDGKDYDYTKDKSHYPDNLDWYPNKHCDARYQNFLDLLFDEVCAKFYDGDRKHKDKQYGDDRKYRRDGKDYHRDDGKKDDGKYDHKEVKECDDKADKLIDEACRAYYHYKPKDDGKKDDGKDKDHKDDGKKWDHKDDGKDWGHKDSGKDDGRKYDDKKDGEKRY